MGRERPGTGRDMGQGETRGRESPGRLAKTRVIIL